jgi:drug/metabolite transporter (DMT)-like permease
MQECRPSLTSAEETLSGADGSPLVLAPGPAAPAKPATPYWAGAAWAVFAISIWAGWFISTRFDGAAGLTAYDIVALRFGVAGVVLLPVAIGLRGGLGLLRWRTALALFAGSGAVYSLSTTAGLFFAPAAEGAALTPGVMPMATALLSVLLFKERLSRSQVIGLSLILAGVIVIAGLGLFQGTHRAWIGHILFVTGAFLFAGYTIALRRSGLSGLEAAALVSVWSCALYLPFYAAVLHPRLFEVPPSSLIIPGFYQGILTNIISLFAYGRAVSALGPTRAAPFAALIPVFAALLSLFLLGEHPTLVDWAGIACVSVGVYAASGAPLRWFSDAVYNLR